MSRTRAPEAELPGSLPTIAFYFWMLLIFRFAFALLFFRENPAVATAAGAALDIGSAYCLLFAIGGAASIKRQTRFPVLVHWILAYCLWCAVSLSWTRATSLISATGYFASMVLGVAIVGAMIRWGDLENVAIASVKGIIAGGWLISLCALLSTSDDPNGRLGNLEFLHPGKVGEYAGQAALCSCFMWVRSRKNEGNGRWLWVGSALFLTWIVLRSLSKTSMIAFVCSAAVFILFSRVVSLKTKVIALVCASLLFCAMYTVVNTYLESYLEEKPGEATTLTGRTLLWAKSWDMIQEHPALGFGFLSFRDYGPQDWDVRTVHAHNEWITQWFQLGLIGLIITIGIYLSYFRHLMRSPHSPQRELGLSMLIYMLIQGFAIAEPSGLTFPLPMMLLLATWAQPGAEAFTRKVSENTLAVRETPLLLPRPS
jgi:exopolysaccharide production protein ExoQ